jgi:hypothetical protein
VRIDEREQQENVDSWRTGRGVATDGLRRARPPHSTRNGPAHHVNAKSDKHAGPAPPTPPTTDKPTTDKHAARRVAAGPIVSAAYRVGHIPRQARALVVSIPHVRR